MHVEEVGESILQQGCPHDHCGKSALAGAYPKSLVRCKGNKKVNIRLVYMTLGVARSQVMRRMNDDFDIRIHEELCIGVATPT